MWFVKQVPNELINHFDLLSLLPLCNFSPITVKLSRDVPRVKISAKLIYSRPSLKFFHGERAGVFSERRSSNYANPVYGVATICHQVRWLRWGHPSLFHATTSLLIWYKMFCVRDISYRRIWMEFINMFSVYAQSVTHSRFNWWIIVVLTYNPSVLMCVEITDAPKL